MSARRGVIAQPCAELTNEGPGDAIAAVLVEVADVASPISSSVSDAVSSAIELNQVATVLAERGTTATVPWSTAGSEHDSLRVQLEALPANADSSVELRIGTVSGGSSQVIVHGTNQHPSLVTLAGAPQSRGVVVTPYYLFEPKAESLRVLRDCMARRRPTPG